MVNAGRNYRNYRHSVHDTFLLTHDMWLAKSSLSGLSGYSGFSWVATRRRGSSKKGHTPQARTPPPQGRNRNRTSEVRAYASTLVNRAAIVRGHLMG